MELSHRSPEFLHIKANAEHNLRKLLHVPDHYHLLFMHGGGHAQFAAAPLNLTSNSSATAHYYITGTWSHRAAVEAAKYCNITQKGSEKGWYQPTSLLPEDIPAPETTGQASTPRPAYCYMCSNETVNGIEYFELPDLKMLQVPLVVDMSSDFGTKPIDFDKVDVAFACTPKNMGIPGLTVVIAKKQLLEQRTAQSITPGILDWSLQAEHDCLWNTPATFNVYVTGLVAAWMLEQGGVREMERRSIEKAEHLYSFIDSSDGFFATPWENVQRSRMNVPFQIGGGGGGGRNEALTEKFIEGAYARNIVGLNTLTPFGVGEYLRASLYVSVTLEDVIALTDWMKEFQAAEQSRST